ncbi:heavy metal translocating P-type ATPase [Natrarchaeobaculum sulfurireducens]|uniref:Cation transport ATPase n=1 Tax=Natrarchaeobaculum sulfurireducens TaxID=2044521 RepID=A0A346PJC4_9EURY|nr:cation-translocating P-type ATPase [Natrarchaeobaculum sulfurireducens]AXR79619.1 Cation transport ATPase [Natrarchaeobaculum sulfurireducens]AXR83392.1 Lead, cadmium, zinc and mercury transporting ATPase / Copper-translocating P-type ATPase [Natrarchaeobaculum sulfurireducens]
MTWSPRADSHLATDADGVDDVGSGECTLCSLPTPADPITDPDVDGEFCCLGCLQVHQTLETVDDVDAESVRERAEAGSRLDDIEDAGEESFLRVEGMHCSTCEAFLETRVESVDGVVGAEASYATETMRVVYDDDDLAEDELPELVSGYGYTARDRADDGADSGSDQALVRFLVGGGMFGMMVMIWYAVFLYPTYFGYEPFADFGSWDGYYVAVNIWLMTSFVLFYTGYPILRGAYVSLRAGVPNMDLLVTTAAVGAYAYSTLAMALGRTDLYFDVSVAVVLVVTAGTYYEATIKRRAASLLSDLTEQQVDEARLENGETVSLEAVDPGDRLLVKPGERVPLDGELTEGTAAVDESLVTGESLPVEKEPGDPLRGGTVVTDAPVVVEVGDEAESTLDRLVSLLWSIQSARPGVQRFADKLATIFVPLVLVLATAVTVLLLATGAGPSTALLVGLTVVIVSCPCALGLATPLAIASGVQEAARRGIVVAAETIFEDAPSVDVVVLDKTGTLTTGAMSVVDVHATDGERGDDLCRRAGAVEALSEHPIAAAIVDAAPVAPSSTGKKTTDGGTAIAADVTDFERERRGVSGVVDGERVTVGHPDFLRERGQSVPDALESTIDDARAAGDVPVAVGWDGRVRGVIVVGDSPRDTWREAVATLSSGREVVVLTGDEGAAADRFRDVDGVDEVFAGVPPEAKAETVRRLRSRGTVAMVGDGSNDAPALAAADVGIAMGSGTKLATDAADAVIVGDDLAAVAETFDVASGTHSRIRQNLGWAFVYNAIAIPLALTGLLNPLFAALAMATSSLLVVLNSSRSL